MSMSSSPRTNDNEFDFLKLEKLTMESKVSKEFIKCDGPNCDVWNPTKTCSRCKLHYYCSRDCQKNHWIMKGSGSEGHKNWCDRFVEREKKRLKVAGALQEEWERNNMDDEEEKQASLIAAADHTTSKEECCICLGPIKNPVMLKVCNHIFCGPCLVQWQCNKNGVHPIYQCNPVTWEVETYVPIPQPIRNPSTGEILTTNCPLCKAPTQQYIYRECIIKANIYNKKAQEIGKSGIGMGSGSGSSSGGDDDAELQQQQQQKQKQYYYYEKSVQELDNILSDKTSGLWYYMNKAAILIELERGQDALTCLEEMQHIDKSRHQKIQKLKKQLESTCPFDPQHMEIQMDIARVQDAIGTDSWTQDGIKLLVAKAYMKIGNYNKALEMLDPLQNKLVYGKDIAQIKLVGSYDYQLRLHNVYLLLAECNYNLGNYLQCMDEADCAVSIVGGRGGDSTPRFKWIVLGSRGIIAAAAAAAAAATNNMTAASSSSSSSATATAKDTSSSSSKKFLLEKYKQSIFNTKRALLYEGKRYPSIYREILDLYNQTISELQTFQQQKQQQHPSPP